MITTGNDKLNDAAKQLVIIKQQKEKFLTSYARMKQQRTVKVLSHQQRKKLQ